MPIPAPPALNDIPGPLTDMKIITGNVDQLSNQPVSLYLISSVISSVLWRTRRIVKARVKTSIKIMRAS